MSLQAGGTKASKLLDQPSSGSQAPSQGSHCTSYFSKVWRPYFPAAFPRCWACLDPPSPSMPSQSSDHELEHHSIQDSCQGLSRQKGCWGSRTAPARALPVPSVLRRGLLSGPPHLHPFSIQRWGKGSGTDQELEEVQELGVLSPTKGSKAIPTSVFKASSLGLCWRSPIIRMTRNWPA